jgi:quercetin dioxygenase-like cupin family protein
MFPVGEGQELVRISPATKLHSGLALGARERYLSREVVRFDGGKLMNRNRVVFVCALLTAVTVLGTRVYSQEKAESAASHKIVHFGDLKWAPIMKGCELAPVAGNPNAEGEPFVLRLRCADGTKVPAHWHPTDENLTVLKGAFLVGIGDTFDESKLATMNVGNFTTMPKEMRHFAICKGETIVQVHGAGPFKVNWVNPAEVEPPDAPSGASAKPKS